MEFRTIEAHASPPNHPSARAAKAAFRPLSTVEFQVIGRGVVIAIGVEAQMSRVAKPAAVHKSAKAHAIFPKGAASTTGANTLGKVFISQSMKIP